MSNFVLYLSIFLLAGVIGMVLAMIIGPRKEYHGPNAQKESEKIYYNKKTGSCVHFAIQPLDCPTNGTNLKQLLANVSY